MDDDQKELLKIGAETALKPFADLINKLFGEPFEQIGGIWKDSLAARRHIRRIHLLEKVKVAIEEAGFEPRQISDNVWVPAIQEATLQDESTIQQKWANLLANEADPRKPGSNGVAFVSMLKELGNREVKFLDTFMDSLEGKEGAPRLGRYDGLPGFTNEQLSELHSVAGLSQVDVVASIRDYKRIMDLLARNGIFSSTPHPLPIAIDVESGYGTIGAIAPIEVRTQQIHRLTELGLAFLYECRAPRKS